MMIRWATIWLLSTAAICLWAGHGQAAESVEFVVTEFVVQGDNPLSPFRTRQILAPFVGMHKGLDRIEAAARALELALADSGYTFHRVLIPPQRLEHDIVVLNVVSYRIGDIVIGNNQYFSEANIRRSLPSLESGEAMNTYHMARDLQVANSHGSKYLALYVKQDAETDRINARIEVQDSRPYQVFAAASNTGTRDTGVTRMTAGFTHNNLFDRDHALTMTYSTSPDNAGDVSQYGAFYRLPIYPLATVISAFYSHSEIKQGIVAEYFDVSGSGTFYGITLDHTLVPLDAYNHHVTIGFQDRFFDNASADTRTGDPLGGDIRSEPLNARYSGEMEQKQGKETFYLEYARNIINGNHNNDLAYDTIRTDAAAQWDAWRYGFDINLRLPRKWLLQGRLGGQWTDEPLIPGEQFGIGGTRSVRGYEEREITGDTGYDATGELWLPPLPDNFQFLVFYDYGYIRRQPPVSTGPISHSLYSAGIGLRWQWRQYIFVSLDGAHVYKDALDTKNGDNRLHYQVFIRY